MIKKLKEINLGNIPDYIFVAGFDTDVCVQTLATELFDMNISPYVLKSYTYSNGGKNSHQAGILCLKRIIGKDFIINHKINSKKSLLEIFNKNNEK